MVWTPCRSFTSLCYSADGESLLAGGQSRFVCIYNLKEQMLMKKFEISCNLSFDGMEVGAPRPPLLHLSSCSHSSLTDSHCHFLLGVSGPTEDDRIWQSGSGG